MDEIQEIFLFGHSSQLNDKEIEFALESYLKDNGILYKQLLITEKKEITAQEYTDRTQYS